MMGGGSATPPTPKPEIPVPQDTDPKGVEAAQKAQRAAELRRGGSALGHLLSGPSGLSDDPMATTPKLMGIG